MIRLHASYSKKIPAESQYSSKSFHASLEVEVADDLANDGRKLQERLRTLWNDLQDAVESQIRGSNGKRSSTGTESSQRPTGNGSGEKASPRQINYLTLLARKAKNWNLSDLDTFVKDRFGNGGVYEISKAEASMLIEEFRAMTGSSSSDTRGRR